jgi:copper chaperone CopZ
VAVGKWKCVDTIKNQLSTVAGPTNVPIYAFSVENKDQTANVSNGNQ